jgi:phosphatidylinositol alpha-1,6-mannosyltransferase
VEGKFGQKMAFRRVYKGCKAFIANSQYIGQIAQNLAKDASKVRVIYPGVNLEALNMPIEDANGRKAILGLNETDFIMISSGRLVEIKNYDGIIKLMPALLQKIPNLKYLIIGTGPEYKKLADLVNQLNLNDQVKFIGGINDDYQAKAFYYQVAHLFIGISLVPEGFGISYLEAQACRTPVIGANNGGTKEAVINGQTGILVDPYNNNEIIDAIYRLASDKELWQKMADAAQKRIREEFNLTQQINKLTEILN